MRAVSGAGLSAIAVLALLIADGAAAQRVVRHGPGASYPVPGPTATDARSAPPVMVRPATPALGQRWGGGVDGQWRGGVDAPGGYAAYRRPYRGWALPTYWIAPRFQVIDWRGYGLTEPLPGYRWTRYYDDAVLIDARGSVYDSRGGIDWDRGDDGYAGDLIHDEGRWPGQRGDYPSPPVTDRYDGGSRWVSPDGATTVTTTSGGYPGGTTVVTVRTAPVVTTTTTTETVEDAVTYTPRKTYRGKYVPRPRSKYLRR